MDCQDPRKTERAGRARPSPFAPAKKEGYRIRDGLFLLHIFVIYDKIVKKGADI